MPLAYQQQKDWSKWITDDRFLGNGFVSDAEGVNIRKSSRGVILSNNKMESVLDTSFLWVWSTYRLYSICEFKWGTTEYSVKWLYSSGVFDMSWSYSEYSWTLSWARNMIWVRSAWVNYWVIVTSNWQLWRWNDDTQPIWLASNYLPIDSNVSDYRPILLSWWFMYIWGNWVVQAIDISTSTWFVFKTVSIPWICRWITEIWDQIFIYSNDSYNWYKMAWDWVSDFPNYIQKLADNPVLNVANMWNYDYMITGTGEFNNYKYRRLFLSQWYENNLLYWSNLLTYDNQLFYFSPIHTNAIETVYNSIFIWWRKCVYRYGKNLWSMQPSLTKDIYINESEQIVSIYNSYNEYLYISYYTSDSKNKIVKYDLREWYAYWSNWYIDMLAIDWWDIEARKNTNQIIVNYKLPTKNTTPTGTTSIDLYAKINWDETRVFTVTWITSAPARWDIYLYNWLKYTVIEYKSDVWQVVCSRWENWSKHNSIIRTNWSMTKFLWVWQDTIIVSNVDNFVFVKSITDTTKRKETILYQKEFYDIEIRAVLKSTEQTITPELYSIKVLFDYIDKKDG